MKKLLIIFAILATTINASAYDFVVNGIYYSYNSESSSDMTVCVTSGGYNCYSGSITIPSTVKHNGYNWTVTKIGYDAFSACSNLTSVTIPNSVSTIETMAFYSSPRLSSVKLGNSIKSIGNYAFTYCSSLTSIDIPNSVTTIGHTVFVECTSLKSFTGKFSSEDQRCLIMNGSLVAFAPAGLTTYTIPNSVKSIGEGAFRESKLNSVVIPNTVTSIGRQAFSDCSRLSEITSLNNTPPRVGEYSFYDVPTSSCVLKVPASAVNAYKTADGWKEFKNIESIKEENSDSETDTDIATLSNAFYAKEPSGLVGETIDLKLCMKNQPAVTSFQFNLWLPKGVTVANDPDDEDSYLMEISGERTTAKKHNALDGSYAKDGSFLVTCASTSNAKFSGNDGEVLTITLNIADDMEAGEYPIMFKNCVITESGTNKSIYPEDVKQTLVIEDYILGDANGDRVVNISDFSAIISHLHGEDSPNANTKAMDVNGDGTVNISDASSIITLIHE